MSHKQPQRLPYGTWFGGQDGHGGSGVGVFGEIFEVFQTFSSIINSITLPITFGDVVVSEGGIVVVGIF